MKICVKIIIANIFHSFFRHIIFKTDYYDNRWIIDSFILPFITIIFPINSDVCSKKHEEQQNCRKSSF